MTGPAIATVRVRIGANAHAGELGFRDFSSLFLAKENRRQPGNPAFAFLLVAECVVQRAALGG